MMGKTRHNRIFKTIAAGVIWLFLLNSTFQGLSFASPTRSFLSTGNLSQDHRPNPDEANKALQAAGVLHARLFTSVFGTLNASANFDVVAATRLAKEVVAELVDVYLNPGDAEVRERVKRDITGITGMMPMADMWIASAARLGEGSDQLAMAGEHDERDLQHPMPGRSEANLGSEYRECEALLVDICENGNSCAAETRAALNDLPQRLLDMREMIVNLTGLRQFPSDRLGVIDIVLTGLEDASRRQDMDLLRDYLAARILISDLGDRSELTPLECIWDVPLTSCPRPQDSILPGEDSREAIMRLATRVMAPIACQQVVYATRYFCAQPHAIQERAFPVVAEMLMHRLQQEYETYLEEGTSPLSPSYYIYARHFFNAVAANVRSSPALREPQGEDDVSVAQRYADDVEGVVPLIVNRGRIEWQRFQDMICGPDFDLVIENSRQALTRHDVGSFLESLMRAQAGDVATNERVSGAWNVVRMRTTRLFRDLYDGFAEDEPMLCALLDMAVFAHIEGIDLQSIAGPGQNWLFNLMAERLGHGERGFAELFEARLAHFEGIGEVEYEQYYGPDSNRPCPYEQYRQHVLEMAASLREPAHTYGGIRWLRADPRNFLDDRDLRRPMVADTQARQRLVARVRANAVGFHDMKLADVVTVLKAHGIDTADYERIITALGLDPKTAKKHQLDKLLSDRRHARHAAHDITDDAFVARAFDENGDLKPGFGIPVRRDNRDDPTVEIIASRIEAMIDEFNAMGMTTVAQALEKVLETGEITVLRAEKILKEVQLEGEDGPRRYYPFAGHPGKLGTYVWDFEGDLAESWMRYTDGVILEELFGKMGVPGKVTHALEGRGPGWRAFVQQEAAQVQGPRGKRTLNIRQGLERRARAYLDDRIDLDNVNDADFSLTASLDTEDERDLQHPLPADHYKGEVVTVPTAILIPHVVNASPAERQTLLKLIAANEQGDASYLDLVQSVEAQTILESLSGANDIELDLGRLALLVEEGAPASPVDHKFFVIAYTSGITVFRELAMRQGLDAAREICSFSYPGEDEIVDLSGYALPEWAQGIDFTRAEIKILLALTRLDPVFTELPTAAVEEILTQEIVSQMFIDRTWAQLKVFVDAGLGYVKAGVPYPNFSNPIAKLISNKYTAQRRQRYFDVVYSLCEKLQDGLTVPNPAIVESFKRERATTRMVHRGGESGVGEHVSIVMPIDFSRVEEAQERYVVKMGSTGVQIMPNGAIGISRYSGEAEPSAPVAIDDISAGGDIRGVLEHIIYLTPTHLHVTLSEDEIFCAYRDDNGMERFKATYYPGQDRILFSELTPQVHEFHPEPGQEPDNFEILRNRIINAARIALAAGRMTLDQDQTLQWGDAYPAEDNEAFLAKLADGPAGFLGAWSPSQTTAQAVVPGGGYFGPVISVNGHILANWLAMPATDYDTVATIRLLATGVTGDYAYLNWDHPVGAEVIAGSLSGGGNVEFDMGRLALLVEEELGGFDDGTPARHLLATAYGHGMMRLRGMAMAESMDAMKQLCAFSDPSDDEIVDLSDYDLPAWAESVEFTRAEIKMLLAVSMRDPNINDVPSSVIEGMLSPDRVSRMFAAMSEVDLRKFILRGSDLVKRMLLVMPAYNYFNRLVENKYVSMWRQGRLDTLFSLGQKLQAGLDEPNDTVIEDMRRDLAMSRGGYAADHSEIGEHVIFSLPIDFSLTDEENSRYTMKIGSVGIQFVQTGKIEVMRFGEDGVSTVLSTIDDPATCELISNTLNHIARRFPSHLNVGFSSSGIVCRYNEGGDEVQFEAVYLPGQDLVKYREGIAPMIEMDPDPADPNDPYVEIRDGIVNIVRIAIAAGNITLDSDLALSWEAAYPADTNDAFLAKLADSPANFLGPDERDLQHPMFGSEDKGEVATIPRQSILYHLTEVDTSAEYEFMIRLIAADQRDNPAYLNPNYPLEYTEVMESLQEAGDVDLDFGRLALLAGEALDQIGDQNPMRESYSYAYAATIGVLRTIFMKESLDGLRQVAEFSYPGEDEIVDLGGYALPAWAQGVQFTRAEIKMLLSLTLPDATILEVPSAATEGRLTQDRVSRMFATMDEQEFRQFVAAGHYFVRGGVMFPDPASPLMKMIENRYVSMRHQRYFEVLYSLCEKIKPRLQTPNDTIVADIRNNLNTTRIARPLPGAEVDDQVGITIPLDFSLTDEDQDRFIIKAGSVGIQLMPDGTGVGIARLSGGGEAGPSAMIDDPEVCEHIRAVLEEQLIQSFPTHLRVSLSQDGILYRYQDDDEVVRYELMYTPGANIIRFREDDQPFVDVVAGEEAGNFHFLSLRNTAITVARIALAVGRMTLDPTQTLTWQEAYPAENDDVFVASLVAGPTAFLGPLSVAETTVQQPTPADGHSGQIISVNGPRLVNYLQDTQLCEDSNTAVSIVHFVAANQSGSWENLGWDSPINTDAIVASLSESESVEFDIGRLALLIEKQAEHLEDGIPLRQMVTDAYFYALAGLKNVAMASGPDAVSQFCEFSDPTDNEIVDLSGYNLPAWAAGIEFTRAEIKLLLAARLQDSVIIEVPGTAIEGLLTQERVSNMFYYIDQETLMTILQVGRLLTGVRSKFWPSLDNFTALAENADVAEWRQRQFGVANSLCEKLKAGLTVPNDTIVQDHLKDLTKSSMAYGEQDSELGEHVLLTLPVDFSLTDAANDRYAVKIGSIGIRIDRDEPQVAITRFGEAGESLMLAMIDDAANCEGISNVLGSMAQFFPTHLEVGFGSEAMLCRYTDDSSTIGYEVVYRPFENVVRWRSQDSPWQELSFDEPQGEAFSSLRGEVLFTVRTAIAVARMTLDPTQTLSWEEAYAEGGNDTFMANLMASPAGLLGVQETAPAVAAQPTGPWDEHSGQVISVSHSRLIGYFMLQTDGQTLNEQGLYMARLLTADQTGDPEALSWTHPVAQADLMASLAGPGSVELDIGRLALLIEKRAEIVGDSSAPRQLFTIGYAHAVRDLRLMVMAEDLDARKQVCSFSDPADNEIVDLSDYDLPGWAEGIQFTRGEIKILMALVLSDLAIMDVPSSAVETLLNQERIARAFATIDEDEDLRRSMKHGRLLIKRLMLIPPAESPFDRLAENEYVSMWRQGRLDALYSLGAKLQAGLETPNDTLIEDFKRDLAMARGGHAVEHSEIGEHVMFTLPLDFSLTDDESSMYMMKVGSVGIRFRLVGQIEILRFDGSGGSTVVTTIDEPDAYKRIIDTVEHIARRFPSHLNVGFSSNGILCRYNEDEDVVRLEAIYLPGQDLIKYREGSHHLTEIAPDSEEVGELFAGFREDIINIARIAIAAGNITLDSTQTLSWEDAYPAEDDEAFLAKLADSPENLLGPGERDLQHPMDQVGSEADIAASATQALRDILRVLGERFGSRQTPEQQLSSAVRAAKLIQGTMIQAVERAGGHYDGFRDRHPEIQELLVEVQRRIGICDAIVKKKTDKAAGEKELARMGQALDFARQTAGQIDEATRIMHERRMVAAIAYLYEGNADHALNLLGTDRPLTYWDILAPFGSFRTCLERVQAVGDTANIKETMRYLAPALTPEMSWLYLDGHNAALARVVQRLDAGTSDELRVKEGELALKPDAEADERDLQHPMSSNERPPASVSLTREEAQEMFMGRRQHQSEVLDEVRKLGQDRPQKINGKRRCVRYVQGSMPQRLQDRLVRHTKDFLKKNGLRDAVSVGVCGVEAARQEDDDETETLYVVSREVYEREYGEEEIGGRVLIVNNLDKNTDTETSIVAPETVALSLGLVCIDEEDIRSERPIVAMTSTLYNVAAGRTDITQRDIEAIVRKENDYVASNSGRLAIEAVRISDTIGETLKMLDYILRHA